MIVYRYGALKPTRGFDSMLEQLRLACRYRNQLVELLNWRIVAEQRGSDKNSLKQLHNETARFLRARSGLGWGTYQAVEADVKRAARSPYKAPRKGSGRARWFARLQELGLDPTKFRARFRRFDSTGRIGANVQACSELTTDDVFKCGRAFGLGPGKKTVAKLLIAKGQWLEVPVLVHRPPPPGTQVVRVLLVVECSGDRWIYSLHVTCKMDLPERQYGSSTYSINFGWRSMEEGVRVAYALGDNGDVQELILPRRLINKMRHKESLRGLADGAAIAYLGDAKRRSKERRRILEDAGATNRELGKLPITGTPVSPEHWARRDRHLYQWESDEGTKFLAQRREIYKLWVRELTKRCSTVTVEQFDLPTLIARDKPVEIPESRHVRFLVAPGSLRQEVKSVFGERCKLPEIRKRTTVCHNCGHECAFDRARELSHVCEQCSAQWDQDANNAENQRSDQAAE